MERSCGETQRCRTDIVENEVRGKVRVEVPGARQRASGTQRRFLVQRNQPRLEVKADFGGFGSRRDVMCAAEGGKEVVEGLFVR